MKRVLTLFSLAALTLAACGSDDDSVSVQKAWARSSAGGQTTGAVYFDLTVSEDDTLVSADVPDSIADRAEIHEVVMSDMEDGDMDSSMEGDMEDGDMADGDMADGDMESDEMESDEMDEMDDMEGSEDMEGMDSMDGAMVMQELTSGLALDADETVSFEPGGYHVMLRDIAAPLEVGDEIELTLEFAEAGSTTLTVEVAESAP